ncbi:MAG: type II toxin-antitoxin system RelE family toxin [Marinobacter sp.]
MTSEYRLEFKPSALKEWNKLAPVLKAQFKKKLTQRLQMPHNQADALSGMAYCYKIKLRSAGYRLVYEVEDNRLVVTVVAVGKRDRSAVYNKAHQRS